ncbi:helix-turn-helix transcriptional regulator (plasmid) [Rhizobium beringeri]|nr:helix-turn-helix transcriptional regulator [Rhizobium beringeri]
MANTTLLDPKQLGFWIKCVREGQKWSQEALAAAAGVDVRTVQRVEAGAKASVITRRAIARGLGYDNPDVFDDPTFVEG